jgi:transcriptional regulator with XRE-family HTH domain
MERESNSLLVFFAAKLKTLRNAKGWSQEALGKRLGYSGEMVSKVETGDARPSGQFAAACDSAFPEMGGMFADLVVEAENSHDVYPVWFRSWVDAEKRANVLRWWEPLLVPGLLQTAQYARALFEAWRTVDGNGDTDTDVAGRLARQAIFDQPSPPSFGAVIDESVLYRGIGGPKVMHDQLLHLADIAERSRITVQVLPAEVGAHVGLLGAFAMAGFADGTPGMVYLESPDEGEATKRADTVAKIGITYDTLRDDALGARASRDLIRRVAEERWKD